MLNLAIFAFVLALIGTLVTAAKGFFLWANDVPGYSESFRWTRYCLFVLVGSLAVGRFASEPERQAKAQDAAQEAADDAKETERLRIVNICDDALTPETGDVANLVYGYYSGGSETVRSDGSILVTIQRTSRVQVSGSCPELLAGSCIIKDDRVTRIVPLEHSGYEPC